MHRSIYIRQLLINNNFNHLRLNAIVRFFEVDRKAAKVFANQERGLVFKVCIGRVIGQVPKLGRDISGSRRTGVSAQEEGRVRDRSQTNAPGLFRGTNYNKSVFHFGIGTDASIRLDNISRSNVVIGKTSSSDLNLPGLDHSIE